MRSANRSQSSRSHVAPDAAVPGVARSRAGARGCRPRTTRCPPGERVGSDVVICPVSRNGAAGTAPDCTWLIACDHVVDRVGDVHGARGARSGAPVHGTAPSSAQSTLTVPGSSSKVRSGPGDRSGTSAGSSSRVVERRGQHVGDDGAADGVPLAVGGADRDRARPPVDLDADDLGAGADLAAHRRANRRGQGLGELAGAALGDREADRLAQHRQQHPHQRRSRGRRAGCRRGRRCRRAAPGPPRPPKRCRPSSVDRREQRLDEAEAAHVPQRGQHADAVADRRERREQGTDEVVGPTRSHSAHSSQPGLAVARRVRLVETGRGRRRGRGAAPPSCRRGTGARAPRARAASAARAARGRRTGSSGEAAASG